MWRSFTHWIGGMGVLVFIMAFVPLSGGRNMHIMKAESTGPDVGKLVPRVRTTAMLLYSIYFGFTLLQFVLLLFGKMSAFEALNTAFSTAGTGGFGFKNDSMLSYSPYIQIVVTVFMLLFSINFGAYYLAFRGKFKEALNSEVRTFLLIVLGTVTVIVISISVNIASDPTLQAQFGSGANLGDIIRHVTFTVASLIATTGFGTVDFALWPALACTILVMVMFVGACAGSTGGGVKVSRFMLMFKGILRDLRAAVHPKQVKQITMDKKPVGQAVVQATFSYFACFMVVVAASVMLLAIDGYDFTTNFTAVAATINNIGPGLSGVGPTCNYAFFSPLSKFVMMFDMLVGRLELFPMLILFMPSTWKK
jgi:trk system potassium uptake protein TrkH